MGKWLAGAVDSAAHVRRSTICTFWGGRASAYGVRQRRVATWNSAGDHCSGWVLDRRGSGMGTGTTTREKPPRCNSYRFALPYLPYSGGRLRATSSQIHAMDAGAANARVRVAPLAAKENAFHDDFHSYIIPSVSSKIGS